MSTLETQDTIWDQIKSLLETSGNDQPTPACVADDWQQKRAGWQAVLEKWLREWERDPSQLADDGIIPPSRETIERACDVAQRLRDLGLLAPQRVAATGDGGIVFAWETKPVLSTLEIDADGSLEVAVFQNARVVSRQRYR